MEHKKLYWISIRWGSYKPYTKTTRRFDTVGELNAYLQGIEDSDGWTQHQIINRNQRKVEKD